MPLSSFLSKIFSNSEYSQFSVRRDMREIATQLSYEYSDMFRNREGILDIVDILTTETNTSYFKACADKRGIAKIERQAQLMCDRVYIFGSSKLSLLLISSIEKRFAVKLPSLPQSSKRMRRMNQLLRGRDRRMSMVGFNLTKKR